MAHEHTVASMQFSHDGRWLATASWDESVVIWDTATWQTNSRMLHSGSLQDVDFSPDGKWLATSSEDFTARVWEVVSGRQVALMAHDGLVMDLTFSRDGKWLATASGDGMARIWLVWPQDLRAEACARLPRNLTREEWANFMGQDEGWIEFLRTNVPYKPTCPALPADGALLGATPTSPEPEVIETRSLSRGLVAATPASVPGAVPTWVSLLTPTPEPTSSTSHVVGNTYTSPTYDYSLTWDNAGWWVRYEYSANGYDLLQLSNGTSNVDLEAYLGFRGDPAACLDYEMDQARAVEGRSLFAPVSDGNGTPLAGQDPTRAHAAYKYTYTSEDGQSEDRIIRLECRTLEPGESVLVVTQVIRAALPDSYDNEAPVLEELLDELTLPEPATAATPEG
jgi:hypothetical protein